MENLFFILPSCCEMHLKDLEASMSALKDVDTFVELEKSELLDYNKHRVYIDSNRIAATIKQRVDNVTHLKNGHVALVKKFINSLRM